MAADAPREIMVKVGLAQLEPRETPEDALLAGIAAVETAARHGADIVVFPEMWQIGYRSCPEDPLRKAGWHAQAIDENSPWIQAFRDAAATNQVAILVTYLGLDPVGGSRNSALLIDRTGADVLSYSKVHTCDFGWERELSQGDGFRVTPLETAAGTVEVGVMICYDREFPESARLLMLEGAEIVLVPNACHMTADRRGQLRARSYENMMATFLTNYAGPSYRGRSCAYDGISETESGQERDQELVLGEEHEAVMIAALDLAGLRSYRARQIWGDGYRRPELYGPLARNRTARAPFVRSRARREPSAST